MKYDLNKLQKALKEIEELLIKIEGTAFYAEVLSEEEKERRLDYYFKELRKELLPLNLKIKNDSRE